MSSVGKECGHRGPLVVVKLKYSNQYASLFSVLRVLLIHKTNIRKLMRMIFITYYMYIILSTGTVK